MKKLLLPLYLLTALLLACGDGVDESSPESVTVAAWVAINEADFDQMRRYATQGSKGGVDFAEMASKKFPVLSTIGRMVQGTRIAKSRLSVDKVVCEKEEATAICYFKNPSGSIDYSVPTTLKKENGVWRFVFIRE